jgi:hypothetical protein
MAEAVYLLCALTSLVCAVLLLRGYARSRTPLLLWVSLCFVALALNNLLVVVDYLVLPARDLRIWRHGTALAGFAVLLHGFIWETRSKRGEAP